MSNGDCREIAANLSTAHFLVGGRGLTAQVESGLARKNGTGSNFPAKRDAYFERFRAPEIQIPSRFFWPTP